MKIGKYCLTGEKLSHSISPYIHSFNIKNCSYDLCEISKKNLTKDFIRSYDGMNITIPYKEEAVKYMDFTDDIVKICHSVNTVVNKAGKLYGYNTDIYGVEQTLLKYDINLKGLNVLILGSGGTANMMANLAAIKGANIFIKSRNKDTTKLLIENINRNFEKIKIYDYYNKYSSLINVVFNGTPVGMYPNISKCAIELNGFNKLEVVFDAVYNPLNTKLLLEAKKRGIKTINGLDMLIFQALKAQELWGITNYYSFDLIYNGARTLISNNYKYNIILLGFMGSGKTAVGNALAKELEIDFIDLDKEIEKREEKTISNIFIEKSEQYFRLVETNILKEIIFDKKPKVISTGGGILSREENKFVIKNANAISIYLDVPFEEINKRLKTDKKRPLYNKNTAKELYKSRLDDYNEYSNIKVKNKSIDDCVEQIKNKLF